jgi:hypothetical protein
MVQLRKEIPSEAIIAWSGYDPASILPGDEDKIIGSLRTFNEATLRFAEYLARRVELSFIEQNIGYFNHLTELDFRVVDEKPGLTEAELASKYIIGGPVNRCVKAFQAAILSVPFDAFTATPSMYSCPA